VFCEGHWNFDQTPGKATCECVFAVIDTASKTGTDNDATAVTFFAQCTGPYRLLILDWDIVQIEGAILETWLPTDVGRLRTRYAGRQILLISP
jgi:hypothetical protein